MLPPHYSFYTPEKKSKVFTKRADKDRKTMDPACTQCFMWLYGVSMGLFIDFREIAVIINTKEGCLPDSIGRFPLGYGAFCKARAMNKELTIARYGQDH